MSGQEIALGQQQQMEHRGSPMAASLEKVLIGGDLSGLDASGRISYYKAVCESVGLNPLTKPFEFLELDGKLVLYAKRDCTDQLRSIHGVSVRIISRELVDGVYVVTAQAVRADGRCDEAIGAVPMVKEGGEWKVSQNNKRYFKGDGTFSPMGPDAKANAIMKAETKAKRRVTLSICGLGMMDEAELDTVRAQPVDFPHPLDGGSREAQSEVRDAKIKQLQAAQPQEPESLTPLLEASIAQAGGPSPPPVTTPRPPMPPTKKRVSGKPDEEKSRFEHMLDAFRLQKEEFQSLGRENRYYEVLARYGLKHSNKITNMEQGEEIYKAVKLELKQVRDEVPLSENLGVTPADLPVETQP